MTETPRKIRAPYRVETKRLVLRPYTPQDAEALRVTTARCKEHLQEFLPWARFEPQTLEQKLDLILGFRAQFDASGNYVYGIFDSQSGELLGGTGLHPRLEGGAFETGYWITPEAQGQGFISESTRAICRIGFDALQLDMLGIRMEVPNTRSENVARKLGFVREGLLRNSVRFGADEPRDALRYTMLRSEYLEQPWHAETCQSVRAFDALERPIDLH